MPPKAVVFTEKKFIDAIKKAESQGLKKFLAQKPRLSTKELVRQSVSGNTFRAFKKADIGHRRPSVTFRETMEAFIDEELDLNSITSQECWNELVNYASNYLMVKFNNPNSTSPLKGGRAKKLVNLVFKYLMLHENIDTKKVEQLIPFLHVPLDSYSLQGIRNIAPEFNIHKNVSMGWDELDDDSLYLKIQEWIGGECAKHGCYRIHYEIAAWDTAH